MHALAAASVEIEHAVLDVGRDAHGVGFEVDACLGHDWDGLEEVTLEPFGVTMSLGKVVVRECDVPPKVKPGLSSLSKRAPFVTTHQTEKQE